MRVPSGILLLSMIAAPALAAPPMPAGQQNELVQTYCAVCHSDKVASGGLTLEHFDAAKADPGVALFLASKLDVGAIHAARKPVPDKDTLVAWRAGLMASADGADRWFIRIESRDGMPLWSAGIVRQLPAADPKSPDPDYYRLTVTCRPDAHTAQIQLSWAPGTPKQDITINASRDGDAPQTFKIGGQEHDSFGAMSVHGAIVLYISENGALALPRKSLTVSGLPHDASINFPFSDLPASARNGFAACLAPSKAS